MRQGLEFACAVVAVLTSIGLLVRGRREPGTARISGWAATAFGTFTLLLVSDAVDPPVPGAAFSMVDRAVLSLTILFPWFLFLFSFGFGRPASWFRWTAHALTWGLVVWGLAITIDFTYDPERALTPAELVFVVVLLAQWAVLLGWMGWRLWTAGRQEPPVASRRVRTLFLGAVTLGAGVLMSGSASQPDSWMRAASQVVVLASGLLFYTGLVPPRWLRSVWRRSADAIWEEAVLAIVAADDLPSLRAALLPAAVVLAGGSGGAIVSADRECLLAQGAAPAPDALDQPAPHQVGGEEVLLSLELHNEVLLLWTSPSVLFFGEEERALLAVLQKTASRSAQRLHLAEQFARQADQQLRDAQATSSAILAAAGEAVLTFERTGKIVMANDAAGVLLACPPSGLVGRPIGELLPVIGDAASAGEPSVRLEAEACAVGGVIVPVEVTLSAVTVQGERLHICVARDVTERRRMSEELRDAAARIEAIFSTAADGILAIDEHGVVESVNPAAERLFGYPAEELVGSNVSKLMSSPLREEHSGYLQRYLTTGQKRVIGIGREAVGRRRDGSAIPLDLAVSEMRVNGRRMFTGILRDISERKTAEQTLLDSAARLAAIVETAVDGILTIDEHGVISTANAATERLFGYPLDELVGRNVSMLMPSPDRERHGQYLRSYLDTGNRRVIGIGRQVVGRRKDGSTVHLDLAVNEMQVGGRRMFTGILRDATERRRAELVLRDRAEALARSNAELQQFAYVASHDLQEPLRKIASYVQILAADYAPQLDDQAREYIGFAVDGAQRMRRLIQDLLAVSRVRVDAMTVKQCDTQSLVSTILEDLSLAIKESHATVEVADLPVIPADPAHLRQVFENLLSNAIKYRRDEPLKIRIEATREEPMWWFRVSDNGIGFKQEYAEKVFGMFQRLVSRREYEGTGMGLAIVSKVVENHGGRIRAESTPGVGTTFVFSLPTTAAPVSAPVAATSADSAANGALNGTPSGMSADAPASPANTPVTTSAGV